MAAVIASLVLIVFSLTPRSDFDVLAVHCAVALAGATAANFISQSVVLTIYLSAECIHHLTNLLAGSQGPYSQESY